MILISLLVHENYEVILDQIRNFKKYAPEAFIIIHPSRQFVESEPEIPLELTRQQGFVLNPTPFYTGTGSVLKCHISNFLFAKKLNLKFSHFCLHSSNDLFVRYGVEDYIRSADFGFFKHDPLNGYNFSNWKASFLSDRHYTSMMSELEGPIPRLASQVEGTFYPHNEFSTFAERFVKHAWHEVSWPINYVHGTNLQAVTILERLQRRPSARVFLGRYAYTKEEFYPPNYFSKITPSSLAPYCYMNWESNLLVTQKDIESIRRGFALEGGYSELFSVKRVNRNIADSLRTWIRELD